MIAAIGLIGRVAGFSFSLVRNIFALAGMVELILVMLFKPDLIVRKDWLRHSFDRIAENPPLLFALVVATLMTFHAYLFFIDDASYLAYLTNWQYSNRLGFMNIVHEVNVIEIVRFWLAMYPMGQALLSDPERSARCSIVRQLLGTLSCAACCSCFILVCTGSWIIKKGRWVCRIDSGFIVRVDARGRVAGRNVVLSKYG